METRQSQYDFRILTLWVIVGWRLVSFLYMDTFQNCYKLLKFSHGCENAKFQILMFEQVNIDNFGHE